MKTVACCCLMMVILSTGTISAQVLLAPRVTGFAGFEHTWWPGSSTSGIIFGSGHIFNRFRFTTNYYYRYLSINDGIIEFNINNTINGAVFPPTSMTVNNWVALVTGVSISRAFDPGFVFPVLMWDLADYAEDGITSEWDWEANTMIVKQLFNEIPAVGTVIDPITVTRELKRDLFGSGMGDETSGFYLQTCFYGSSGDHHLVICNPDSVRLEVFINTTPTPWATPTFTPIPTSTPTPPPTITPTNTPVINPVVRIWMPSDHYLPNQFFACLVSFQNQTELLLDMPLFVILDVHGCVFCAPEFNDDSYYLVNVPAFETRINVIDPFFWPEGCGSAEDIRWYAALTDPSMTTVISNIDMFTFGWSE